jgi:hypothetical protein
MNNIVKSLFFLIILISFKSVLGNVIINEIMYNPIGTDTNHEWIEIYSTDSINLSGWYFYENEVNHNLNLISGGWILNGYAVIADNSETFLLDYPDYNSTLIDSSWSSLSNTGESIAIKDKSKNIIDELSYPTSFANGDSFSLSLIERVWKKGIPSPGNKNKNTTIELNQPDLNTNNTCNIKLNITLDKEIYLNEENIKFYNNLNNESIQFIIEYWIEDLFGNVYKKKYNTSNTNKKSWKTNIEETDKVLFIKSKVYPFCNDSNIKDNSYEKMFIVKSDTTLEPNSKLEIIEFDEEIKFGDSIEVKIKAYKGDTNKYLLSAYILDGTKKISDTTKIHIYNKFSHYDGQLSIQLKPNCDLKIKDGRYDLVLKGLGKQIEERIKIKGINSKICENIEENKIIFLEKKEECVCPTNNCNKNQKSLEKYNIINQLLCTDKVHYKKTYQISNKQKIKSVIPYLIIVLLIILTIILTKKQKHL